MEIAARGIRNLARLIGTFSYMLAVWMGVYERTTTLRKIRCIGLGLVHARM